MLAAKGVATTNAMTYAQLMAKRRYHLATGKNGLTGKQRMTAYFTEHPRAAYVRKPCRPGTTRGPSGRCIGPHWINRSSWPQVSAVHKRGKRAGKSYKYRQVPIELLAPCGVSKKGFPRARNPATRRCKIIVA